MKFFTAALVLLLITASADAQFFKQFDIGIGASANVVSGDAETRKVTPSGQVNFNYNITPFSTLVADLQGGVLKGGDKVNTFSGRQFTNNYFSTTFRIQLQAGELIDYSRSAAANMAKGLYVSTGIGFAFNNIKEINRVSLYLEDYITPGTNNGISTYVPLRFGYELKIINPFVREPRFKLDFAVQHNILLDDGIDGFKAGLYKDTFTQLVLGLKMEIAAPKWYRKRIDY